MDALFWVMEKTAWVSDLRSNRYGLMVPDKINQSLKFNELCRICNLI